MAEELLERVLREVRERKGSLQAAVEESARLERALAALAPKPAAGSRPVARGSEAPARPPRRRLRAAPGANRRAILALVSERPGVTAGEISGATGIARSTVSPTLARLSDAGAIERVKLPGRGVGYRSASEAPLDSDASQTGEPASSRRASR
jgi:DNA-binding transcriptional ArsR family regulator